MKFTPPGGRVEVSARRRDGTICIAVSDTGIGIAKEDQELVFESFQRGNNAGRQHSAGLGLSLVKRFVELHGGRVTIDSAPDQGTTITCLIPSSQGHKPALSVVAEAG